MAPESDPLNPASDPHPSEQTLRSYSLGQLDAGQARAVDQHLRACPECRRFVSEATSDSFLGRVRDALPSRLPSTSTPVPPPSETLPPGLADHPDYHVKKELGRGGMGVVYLAHNTLMGRDEVLKVMGAEIVNRPGVLDRFLREIRAIAGLRHPNVVTAYSAFRLGESLVFAMEYVEGLDLSRLVKLKGPLPVAHACHFIHQAALGLQSAHEKGLVHRDVKPGNLMLSRVGNRALVKVLDFGLARATQTQDQNPDSALTREGQALGTPDYIAPEQILDAPSADVRADIYSLGGTLFYLLTSRPPFQAKSLYDLYQAHISRTADPLNLLRPEVPAELAALVAKMLAKDPRKRFQTPSEVARALVPFFKKSSIASPSTDVSRANPLETTEPEPRASEIRKRRAGGVSPLSENHEERNSDRETEVAVGSTPLSENHEDTNSNTETEPAVGSTLPSENHQENNSESGLSPPARPNSARLLSVGAGVLLLGFLIACASWAIKARTPVDPLPTEPTTNPPAVETQASPEPKEPVFVPLFNGENLLGWQIQPPLARSWKVIDGILIGAGPRPALLWTNRSDYQDFHLRVVARIGRIGNSGVFFRAGPSISPPSKHPGCPSWYEAQITSIPDSETPTGTLILSNTRHVRTPDTWRIPPHRWFMMEVIAEGNHVLIKVNGHITSEFTERPRCVSSGYIALQHYIPDTVVEFRQIEIKELPPESPSTPDGTSP